MKISVPIRLGFLGGGNMAEAILRGVIANELLPSRDVLVTDISEARRQYLDESTDAQVIPTNIGLLKTSNVVVVAVKPQDLKKVLEEIKHEGRHDHLFLSICAGKRTETIEEILRTDQNPHPRVIRVMPNLPARIGLGVAGICTGEHTDEIDLAFPQAIFEAVGEVVVVPESLMDAVTAVSGTGPAYVFYVMECLIDAARQMGFTEEQAKTMVLHTFMGSVRLACESDVPPAELRRQVTSPGGTTAAGIAVLEKENVHQYFVQCVNAAAARAKELSKD